MIARMLTCCAVAAVLIQAGARQEDPALSRALAAVRSDAILADVEYVACDDMGGRETPSVGERLTARFLCNRLRRIGWRPGAQDGWFHTYPVLRRVLEAEDCSAIVRRDATRLELVLGDDYSIPPREIDDHEVDGGVVYVGRIPTGELDAATRAELRGRWALFTEDGGSIGELDASLRLAGAIGVLTTIDVVNTGGDPEARHVFRLYARMMKAGCVSRPSPLPPLPCVYLPRSTIEELLTFAGVSDPAPGSLLPIDFAETRSMSEDETIDAENVVALWPGDDSELRRQVVILSAHYDHIGVDAQGRVCNGADDNGSGTSALLALADALAAYGPLDCTVLLCFTSGEERGLWGSQAFVDQPWFPAGMQPVANINLDMVGRNAVEQITVTPFDENHEAYSALARRAAELARDEGFTDLQSGDAYYHRSDNFNFAKLGIPTITFSDDLQSDYHKYSDDAAKVDGEKIGRVVRTLLRLLHELQVDPRGRTR